MCADGDDKRNINKHKRAALNTKFCIGRNYETMCRGNHGGLPLHYPSHITHHPLPITHHASPITHNALPITHHPSSISPLLANLHKWQHLNIFGKAMGSFPWIDHPQPLQGKIFNGNRHGSRQSGDVFIFEFHTPVSPLRLPEKVEFRTGVCTPKIEFSLFLVQGSSDAIESKTFPGSSKPG